MAYMGQRRLEKILYFYLNDRSEFLKEFKSNLKFDRKVIFDYWKNAGTECLSAYYLGFYFEIVVTSMGLARKRLSFSENEFDRKLYYGNAFYSENFYPIYGDIKIMCYDICKNLKE